MVSSRQKRGLFKNPINLVLIFILIFGSGYFGYQFINKKSDSNINKTSTEQVLNKSEPEKPKTTLKNFTGPQFRELYNNFAYPNTEYIAEDTNITGDTVTDQHIQKLAEAKGYKKRSAPVADTFVKISEEYKLQRMAYQPWIDMQKKAKSENINLNLKAAYRSADDQRQIFLERLNQKGIRQYQISTGFFDTQINEVLATTAIPGYSRHHTGYTIDITCDNQPNFLFENTICFDWLSKDNYKNAKTYGWIPSYPEDAGAQGPEPESWEYVWVGTDATYE